MTGVITFTNEFENALIPVSYTHLDVYKRQMLYSASSSRAYAATGDSMYFMKSQFGGLLVGIVAMIGCMMVDYHVIAR